MNHQRERLPEVLRFPCLKQMPAENYQFPDENLEQPDLEGPGNGQQTGSGSRRRKNEKPKNTGQTLNRWPRAFARLFELSWQMPLVMTGLLMVLSSNAAGGLTGDLLPYLVIVFMSLPIALVLDALIAGIFGNTPVKAIIGVKAISSRGERLNFGKHLKRNIGVWTDGMALGLIPISLLTMFRQFKRVSGRRETIYDEKLHVRVRSGRFTGLRVVLVLLLMIAAVVAVFLRTAAV